MTAEELAAKLGLEPIQGEGGWFRRLYTGPVGVEGRPVATSIYALFSREQFSALHRLDADEQFFFLDGDPLEVFEIDVQGQGRWLRLGRGDALHHVFRAGSWFGGRCAREGTFGWSLVSAVVSPGFEWVGFELGKRSDLVALYPEFEDEIAALTR